MRIAVFNTFDITPAQNGGEIRMLNLYQRLSQTDPVRVLSYDLRCKKTVRRDTIPPALDITDTLVTDTDRWTFFQANDRLGLYPHDVLCIDTYEFSPAYLREIDRALAWCDVVVVSHPYLATTIFSRCTPLHLRVFEAHNVELHVKRSFFASARDRILADRFIDATRRCEAYALETADIVVTVGEGDSRSFVKDYGAEPAKLHVVPNGVNVSAYDAISAEMRDAFREEAGLINADVGVFLGSAYGPNVDSYRIARAWLDEAGFDGTVFIIGSISDVYDDSWAPVCFSEHWLGFVDDATKHLLVATADFAIQIMASGGGTNLKLFDYMASGTPIIANQLGRRGVDEDGWFIPVENGSEMRDVISTRRWRGADAARAANIARDIALRDFDWDRIAKRYRAILA
jgi:glycosyltransferase involved in cell wall biosynthesis